jgi:hypothetical protein
VKLDGGTIAAFVTAGAALFAFLLSWRQSAGRALTYNRLGQLLDMRAKVPAGLETVQRELDQEITRVARRLHVHDPADNMELTETADYEPDLVNGEPSVFDDLSAFTRWSERIWQWILAVTGTLCLAVLIGGGWNLATTPFDTLTRVIGIVFMSLGFGAVGYLIRKGIRRRCWRLLLPARRRRSGTYVERNAGSSGDVDAAGTTGAPLPRGEGLDSGPEPNLPGAKIVDRGGEL